MKQDSLWRRPTVWLGVIVSVGSLLAFVLLFDIGAVITVARTARFDYLLMSGAGLLAFLILRAFRWRFMLGNQVPVSTVFHIQNIGYFLNYLLPARAGEVARAVLIGNVPPVTLAQGLSTMVVERVLDLLFVVILLPFTLAEVETLPPEYQVAARTAGVLSISATVVLIIAANQRPRVRRWLGWVLDRIRFLDTAAWVGRVDDLLSGLDSLTRWRDGLLLLILSIVVWLPIIGAYYTGLLAVGIEPTWPMAAFTVCAAALAIAAPSSPGQIGVFEVGVSFALVSIMGQPETPSAGFAILYHALNALVVIIFGAVGIYATGATFGRVMNTAQEFARRRGEKKGN